MTIDKHKELLEHALHIKQRFLDMYNAATAGHIGCSLSCAEMMTYIFFGWMKDTDEFILSKGHAAAVLYSTLCEKGLITDADISTFYKNNTYLAAHPPANKLPKVPFATGSLGHGLSLAAGFGLAARLKKSDKKIYCITSDGELDEGSTWEAAMFIAHHNLNNVVWMIDRNKIQGFGRTEEVIKLEPLADKLKAFGFDVIECDGHDFKAMDAVRLQIEKKSHSELVEPPVAIICNTTKGNGVKYFEDTVDCHYLPMKGDQYTQATDDIATYYKTQLENA